MNVVYFDPLDTLFFRDGRPYHQGELSQAGVASLVPPYPVNPGWCHSRRLRARPGLDKRQLGRPHPEPTRGPQRPRTVVFPRTRCGAL